MLSKTAPENEGITDEQLAILIGLNCFHMARPESQDLPEKALKKKQTIINPNEYKFKDGWITRKEIQNILVEISGSNFNSFESRIGRSIKPLKDKGFVEEGKITWSRGIGRKQINGVVVNRINPTPKNLLRIDKILSKFYWQHYREIQEHDIKKVKETQKAIKEFNSKDKSKIKPENLLTSQKQILIEGGKTITGSLTLNRHFISMLNNKEYQQWTKENKKEFIKELAERTASNEKEFAWIQQDIEHLIRAYGPRAKEDYDQLVKAKLQPFKEHQAQTKSIFTTLSSKIENLRRAS